MLPSVLVAKQVSKMVHTWAVRVELNVERTGYRPVYAQDLVMRVMK